MSDRAFLPGYAAALRPFARVVAVALVVAACSQSAARPKELGDCVSLAPGLTCSSGVGVGATAAGSCGEFGSPAAACQTCLDASCCGQNQQCSGNAACVALATCIAPCTTDACVTSCRSANAAGVAAFDAFDACIAGGCTTACTSASGNAGTAADAGAASQPQCGALTSSIAACQSCVEASCCAEDLACSDSTACLTLLACEQACAANDAACIDTCRTQNAPGVAPLTAFSQCVSARCPACN